MEDKKYLLVTAKFRMTADDVEDLAETHLISNIQSAVEHGVSEVEFSSEYYGDGEEEVWTSFLENDVKLEINKISVRICSGPDCEHCGMPYDDFGIEIFDGGTTWCYDCFTSNEPDFFTQKEYDNLMEEVDKEKEEFYTHKLNEIKKRKKNKKLNNKK